MPTSQPGFYRRITELARSSGLRRERPTGLYSIWTNGNLGVIDLQRAKYSDRKMAAFAPKLGVSSELLAEPLGQPLEVQTVSFGAYHWDRWAGYIHGRSTMKRGTTSATTRRPGRPPRGPLSKDWYPCSTSTFLIRGFSTVGSSIPIRTWPRLPKKAYAVTLVAKIGPREALDPLLRDISLAIAAGGHVAPRVPALLQ